MIKSYKHNVKLTGNAKRLRREMTEEERKLWYLFLRTLPVRFLRQKVIDGYIVDFYCAQAKLVIEIDGSQHYQDKGVESDCIRDQHLMKKRELTVLRFSNRDIQERFQAVCDSIENIIMKIVQE